MYAQVAGQLGVEGGREQVSLPNRDNPTGGRTGGDAAHYLDVRADRLDPRRPDEHGVDRLAVDAVDHDRRLERVDLPPERVAPDGHLDAGETLLVGAAVEDLGGQHDHAGAGPVHRHAAGDPLAERFEQPEVDRELADGGRLAARDHQGVDGVELVGPADRSGQRVALRDRAQVFADVTLQGQDANDHRGGLPAPLGEPVRLRDVGDVDADHRLAQAAGNLREHVGVVVERGRLDDRGRPLLRVAGLEDAGADEHTLGTELHHHRGVG